MGIALVTPQFIQQTASIVFGKWRQASPIHSLPQMRTIQNARPGSTSTFGLVGRVALDTTIDGVSLISTS
jgi:hypothetical protein